MTLSCLLFYKAAGPQFTNLHRRTCPIGPILSMVLITIGLTFCGIVCKIKALHDDLADAL